MGFGRKYKDLPTPESVVWRYKIANRIAGSAIVMIQGWDFIPTIPAKIATGLLGAFMAVSRDIEGMYGIKTPPMVKSGDVEVVKDDALKTVAFFIMASCISFF